VTFIMKNLYSRKTSGIVNYIKKVISKD
jgi:hypothetical protein